MWWPTATGSGTSSTIIVFSPCRITCFIFPVLYTASWAYARCVGVPLQPWSSQLLVHDRAPAIRSALLAKYTYDTRPWPCARFLTPAPDPRAIESRRLLAPRDHPVEPSGQSLRVSGCKVPHPHPWSPQARPTQSTRGWNSAYCQYP